MGHGRMAFATRLLRTETQEQQPQHQRPEEAQRGPDRARARYAPSSFRSASNDTTIVAFASLSKRAIAQWITTHAAPISPAAMARRRAQGTIDRLSVSRTRSASGTASACEPSTDTSCTPGANRAAAAAPARPFFRTPRTLVTPPPGKGFGTASDQLRIADRIRARASDPG